MDRALRHPRYRKGVVGEREIDRTARAEDTQDDIAPGSAASQALAGRIATGVSAVHALLQEIEPYLGDICLLYTSRCV